MTAEHEGAAGVEGAGEYGGMDALMAAITGDPLPPAAHRDAAFRAEHRAAEADVAVLRQQLTWLAETLTGEHMTEEPAGEPTADPAAGAANAPAAEGPERAEDTERAEPTGSAEPPAPADATAPARPSGPAPVKRPRSATRPAGPARPARPPRPGRPSGPRRAWRIALGTLAGAAAFGLVFGFVHLTARSGGGAMSAGAADAKSAEHGAAEAAGDGGRPEHPAQVLACYRLVAEGTVATVEREPDDPWTRIVLTVRRSYTPAHTPDRVTFVLDGGAEPAPRPGQHVLVGIGRGQDNAGLWAVGDTRVAVNRAWITEALPKARTTACPQEEEPTEKP